jgi:hypothetical protein
MSTLTESVIEDAVLAWRKAGILISTSHFLLPATVLGLSSTPR